jgi:pyruvate/2-oxoglutarate dehydrogenase complex dihydrolipoamide acyltransferase (E2) component
MKYDEYNTPWRLVANTVFGRPKDGKLYGTMDVDITDTEKYMWAERKSKRKITMTSIVIAAVARTLAEDTPEINCFIRRGRIIPRDYVDIMTAVLLKGGTAMSSVRINNAHTKSVLEIAMELREKALNARQGDEDEAMNSKHALSKIPWPFRKWIYLLIRLIVYGFGLEIKSLGISEKSFGSISITNVGTLGLTNSFPALMPMAKLPAVIAIGKIEKRPVVINDKIEIRTILAGSAAFDHRLVDGIQIANFVKGVIRRIQNPELLEK